jgi:hypothetical protein
MMSRKKAETVEEFLARGGKVTIIPPVIREDTTHTLPVKTTIDFDSLSLGESEYLFGETRQRKSKTPKKRVTSDDFTAMVEASGLPASVVEALKNSVRK